MPMRWSAPAASIVPAAPAIAARSWSVGPWSRAALGPGGRRESASLLLIHRAGQALGQAGRILQWRRRREPISLPQLVSVLSIWEEDCAHRRDRRRAWRDLLRLSLEAASPGCRGRTVRTEPGRRHLGLWRGVLRAGAGILARRRSRDGRRDRAEDGELEQHHAQSARRER